jgi:hypothetical protein
MRAEDIAQKHWAYTLYRLEDGRVVLSVLFSGLGMFELNIPLDDEATAKAIVDGNFQEEYTSNIRSHHATQQAGL